MFFFPLNVYCNLLLLSPSSCCYRLAKLLKWGAMDAEAHPDVSANVIQILWDIATKRSDYSDSYSCVKAKVAAFLSLSHYEVFGLDMKKNGDKIF
jgi:hypothetical protein